MVFVQQMPTNPLRAAWRPYAPPRIQWLVFRMATQPTPERAASSIALSIAENAFVHPMPLLPFHRSRAPKDSSMTGSAAGSICPLRI